PAPDAGQGAAQPGTTPVGLIVEDSETQLDPKQMRKSDFLAALRPQVEEAVDEGYTDTLDRLAARAMVAARFAMYGAQDARSLEQTIQGRYIPVIVTRVKAQVAADNEEKKKNEEAQGPGIFFKGRNGGSRDADNPRAIHAELRGGGQRLPSDVRSGIESAMG